MKKGLARKIALILAAVILLTSTVLTVSGVPDKQQQENPSPTGNAIVWDFEKGTLDPFKLIEGSLPKNGVTNLPYEHNNPQQKYTKQGTYFFSTLESAEPWPDPTTFPEELGDLMTVPTDANVGTIQSPVFRVDPENRKVNFLVGGGSNPAVYVAVCNIYGHEIHRAQGQNGETMRRVEFNLSPKQFPEDLAFVKVVDKTDGPWGHITFDDFHATGVVLPEEEIRPEPLPELKWSFEDGVIDPFVITEGAFGEKLIIDFDCDRNTIGGAEIPNNKDGKYYLCTVETDGAAPDNYNEAFVGELRSPDFHILSPNVTLKIAGGPGNYVAVCDAATNEELAKVSPEAGGNIFADVSMNLGEQYQENRLVYIKIVDNTVSNYGYISVDGICAKGVLPAEDVKWSFETGTVSPFSVTKGAFDRAIGNRDTEINPPQNPINKDGKFYFTSVEVNDDRLFDDTQTGELRSPNFTLAEPKIQIRLGGGYEPNLLYVAVCDAASGRELSKIFNTESLYIFKDRTWDLKGAVKPNTPVFLKIVDNCTTGWGNIIVDDIRFRGNIARDPVVDIHFDFEEGTVEPWKMLRNSSFGKPIGSRDTDFNAGAPIQKNGTYYLTTEENADGAPVDAQTGVFRSPVFTIDVENNPKISFLIGGGSEAQTGGQTYVALKRTDGTIVQKWFSPASQYIFTPVEADMTGKVTSFDKLYLEVYDQCTTGWGFTIFDHFQAKGTFPKELPIQSEEELSAITGWDEKRFEGLETMVMDLLYDFPEEYTKGEEYLASVTEMKELHYSLWAQGEHKATDPDVMSFAETMDKLQKDIIFSNPLLQQAPIVFVTRNQYRGDHHNTHNMFPDTQGEINIGSYQGGGAIKVIDFSKGGQVSVLKESDTGLFRDPDVSYDGNKILISHRRQKANDSYNIWEYTLNADKTAIAEEKQLTAMYTADHMDPMYLPSGNIVFAGTRDPKYVMCNRHISSNLYRMEADGANIVKITNSTLYERPTDVLPDGRILYDRWEYNDRDFGSAQGLWAVNEDGTEQVTYYGNNTPDGAFIDAKVVPGTLTVLSTWSSTHDRAWGGLVLLDRNRGVDGRAPVLRTWPAGHENDIRDPNGGGRRIDLPSGFRPKYEDPQPLSDKYFLASRTIDGKGEKTGLYLLDIYGNETLLYEDPSNLGVYDANLLMPRDKEVVRGSRRNYEDKPGAFFVQDVYEGTHMQGVERGTVKTLRIVESMPKHFISQNQQWGGEGQQNPAANWHSFEEKRVIGEVPVYEDGSAYFEVPQDKFVYFQLLDAEGRMVQSMRSGTLVQSGERTGCIGCHEDRRMAPISDTAMKSVDAMALNLKVIPNPEYKSDSETPGVAKTIAVTLPDKPQKRAIDFEKRTDSLADYDDAELYPTYEDLPSMNYLSEVQPIFTRNCISCHGYENPAAGLTLVPDKGVVFNASYVDLWRNRGKHAYFNGSTAGAIGGGGQEFTTAKQWGSYNSTLVKKIYEDPDHAKRLTDAEKRRIAEWVDLNAPYHGDYASNYGQNPAGRCPLTGGELNSIPGGLQWGFNWGERRPTPIYFDNPEKSPILKRWPVGSAEYNKVLALIRTGRDRLAANPDIDWRGLTAIPGNPDIPIQPYKPCPMDAWRIEKLRMRDALERANRQAIVNGEKRYDWDNEKDGLKDWPEGWPGWPR